MSEDGPIIAVILCGILLMGVPGGVVGYQWAMSQSREKFIIYCTLKGDTYEECDKIWIGGKP